MAHRLKKCGNQIKAKIKRDRWNKIMKLQQKISHDSLREKIGKEYEVLLENITEDGKYFIGRTYMDVPDMDGVIYVPKNKKINLNSFANCKIIDVNEYDLIGKITV